MSGEYHVSDGDDVLDNIHHAETLPAMSTIDLTPPSINDALSGDFLTEDGDKYQLGDVVARGGMGAILDAMDLGIRRHVAMKVILDPDANDVQLARFIEEAQVTGQLEHPNIVPIHELGIDRDGKFFYTMKFVQGRTLESIVDDIRKGDETVIQDYPLSRLLDIYLRVCDGIAFAHAKGVIHRDLKLENVMIGEFGEVQIMDWGIAKVLSPEDMELEESAKAGESSGEIESIRQSDDALKTMAGSIVGTPAFMAPEQALGQTIDHRADIYSLGVMLYNILSLHTPIEDGSAKRILMRVVKGDVQHISHWNEVSARDAKVSGRALVNARDLTVLRHCPEQQIPDSLAAVAMKALALEPDERYQTVKGLQQDIEAYQRGYATSAEGAGFFRLVGLLIQRHRAAFLASLLVLLSFVVLIVGFVIHVNGKEQAAQLARAEAEQAKEKAELVAADRQQLAIQSAPQFADAATRCFSRREWKQGFATAALAVQMDPEHGPAWFEKGRGHLARLEVGHAIDCFRSARKWGVPKSKPYQAASRYLMTILKFARGMDTQARLSPPQCHELGLQLQSIGDAALAAQLLTYAGDASAAAAVRLQAAGQELALRHGISIEDKRYVLTDGHTGFNLGGLPVADLSPLAGLPLTYLHIRTTEISRLDDLRGMPLRHLDIGGTAIRDLSPIAKMPLSYIDLSMTKVDSIEILRGMSLRFLNVSATGVTDLSPVENMVRLEQLNIGVTKIRDLEPLRGLRLRSLRMHSTQVRDISLLAGMPLEDLELSGLDKITDVSVLSGMPLKRLWMKWCTGVTDISVLKDCPWLVEVALPPNARNIEVLREHKHLKYLSYSRGRNTSAAKFWAEYDAKKGE